MTLLKRDTLFCSITALLLLLGTACGDDDADDGHGDAPDASEPTGIEIAGTWASEFGDETITDTSWDNGFSTATIVSLDNDRNEAITQDPPGTDDAGVTTEGAFSKLVWTEVEGDAFYYCTVAYGQPDAEAADANAMPADNSDPGNAGCGDADFPWTKLERQ